MSGLTEPAVPGTTTDGTAHIGKITTVLNGQIGNHYRNRKFKDGTPTDIKRKMLLSDVVYTVGNKKRALVVNIHATPGNHPPGYPSQHVYHYFTVIGYEKSTGKVYIADSANFSGKTKYWMTAASLASMLHAGDSGKDEYYNHM